MKEDGSADNNINADDSSRSKRTISTQSTVVKEHSFDTEGGGGEGDFNTESVGGRAVSIQWVAVERTVVEPGKEAIFASLLAYVASKFYFLETTFEIVEVQE